MTSESAHSVWKHYSGKELTAHFDLSAHELAECATEGLILPPAPRHKGRPYSEMDFLRLSVFKRCIQAGYGLDEVLDLIGRIHRRTAPIKTVILAKAYASDKLSELEAQMTSGDTLERVNLHCDADILQAYIDKLTRLQNDMGTPRDLVGNSHEEVSSPPKQPVARAPQARAGIKPPVAKRRPSAKRSYPRPFGAQADEVQRLWKHATPGSQIGWVAAFLTLVLVIGGYLYLNPPSFLNFQRSASSPEDAAEIAAEADKAGEDLPVETLSEETVSGESALVPPKPPPPPTKPKPAKPVASGKAESLTKTAASDLEKIMAASGDAAAAMSDMPRIIKINELVVFFDLQTRILRTKIELLKNLVADAPPVIAGRLFMVLKPIGGSDVSQEVITLPRIPLSANNMNSFAEHGIAFSLEDQKTTYIKTQLSKPPVSRYQATVYIFDRRENLLLRETHTIRIKDI